MTYTDAYRRPFSLADKECSYPFKPDIVSVPIVAIISLAGPAAVILSSMLFRMFLPSSGRRPELSTVIWETHASLLGLVFGLATTLFITAGSKDMIGKPRPDMLARCQPDLTDINKYVVGGFGMNLDTEAPPFLTSAICLQKDRRLLDDGFGSFPSDHSSFSSAGIVYLTLWLLARFRVSIFDFGHTIEQVDTSKKLEDKTSSGRVAPPLWLVAITFTPIGVALFICASRYTDFHHA